MASNPEDPKEPKPKRSTELTIFGSRENSNPGNPIQIRETVRDLRVALKKHKGREGQDAHDNGTQLRRLFHEFAEQVYGHESFLDFAKAELDLGTSSIRRYVRVSRYANATQAAWGVEAVLDAASIVDLIAGDVALQRKLGLRKAPATISDLAKVKLEITGGTLRLAGSPKASEIEDALERIKARNSPGQRRLPASMRAQNAELKHASETVPALRGVVARFVERAGKRSLDVSMPPGSNLVKIAQAIERVLSGE